MSARSPEAALASSRIRLLDFRSTKNQEKFGSDQLQSLGSLHETAARLLGSSLSANLRLRSEFAVRGIEQVVYQEVLRNETDSALTILFSMEPLPGSAILRIDLPCAFAVLDRLLGGEGHSSPVQRPFTEIEKGLISRFFQRVLASYRESWTYVVTPTCAIEQIVENFEDLNTAILPEEYTACIRGELRFGKVEGRCTFFLPRSLFHEVNLQSADASYLKNASKMGSTEEYVFEINQHLEQALVDIEVELGTTNVLLQDLLELQPGHVIVFDKEPNQALKMQVNGQDMFSVYPGFYRDHYAVKVVKVIEEKA